MSSPIWGSWPDIYYVWQLPSCFCGAPSLTRGGSVFYICAGPCQRSLRPYFTVSDTLHQVKVKVTLRLTVSQSVSKSWCRAPTVLTVTVWLLWGALSDERTGLSFVYAAGPCQRSLSRVRLPWGSRPHFTVPDLRLPISSPPTTRRVTVEVFDPASTLVSLILSTKVKVTLRLTASQSVNLGVEPLITVSTVTVLFFRGRPLWREDGSV
jgi:hypothetical protein